MQLLLVSNILIWTKNSDDNDVTYVPLVVLSLLTPLLRVICCHYIGADMIELDVCIDRSGDVVVHHDLYLSDGRLLETLTLAEIKRVAPEVSHWVIEKHRGLNLLFSL